MKNCTRRVVFDTETSVNPVVTRVQTKFEHIDLDHRRRTVRASQRIFNQSHIRPTVYKTKKQFVTSPTRNGYYYDTISIRSITIFFFFFCRKFLSGPFKISTSHRHIVYIVKRVIGKYRILFDFPSSKRVRGYRVVLVKQ